MKLVAQVKDKARRYQERRQALDYQCVFSDSVTLVNALHWDRVASSGSIFLGRAYLQTIEENAPENTRQKYAMAYINDRPVVIVACQVAEISGEDCRPTRTTGRIGLARQYRENVLVCGNLVSSGLHGMAFTDDIDADVAWRIVAELLYRIRRAEKLNGKIDFVLIKDLKSEALISSKVIERFSYRRIQTDPDMVLMLNENVESFEGYLASLTSKYRSRVRKIIKSIDQGGFQCEKVELDARSDAALHRLYLNVERKSATRLATLPKGYFLALSESLKENFCCCVIKRGGVIVGFVTTIKDGKDAVAYYVGVDYTVNADYPIYFRLLQLVIQSAIELGCRRISFGRTALEPKANLGAKPVETFVWARHRVPLVNVVVRSLFKRVPFDTAPSRAVIRQ